MERAQLRLLPLVLRTVESRPRALRGAVSLVWSVWSAGAGSRGKPCDNAPLARGWFLAQYLLMQDFA